MNRKASFIGVLVATLLPLGQLAAQAPDDHNEGSRLSYDSTNEIWRFKWWGKSGRTYFIQHSEDLNEPWLYVPVVESGDDSIREWGFTTTGDKFFVRLRHSDIPTSDPESDDFDEDGLSNMQELLFGTDPFHPDTDGDGYYDGVDPEPLVPNHAPVFGTFHIPVLEAGVLKEADIPATDSDGDLSLFEVVVSEMDVQFDFDQQPVDAVLFGDARIASGVLELTTNAWGKAGTMQLPGVAFGNAFHVQFDLFIGGGTGADGFCFAYGPLGEVNVDERFVAENTLVVQFDTYGNGTMNGYDDEANTIEVWFGATRLAKAHVTLRTASFVPVEIIFENDLLSVKHNGVTVLEDVEMPVNRFEPADPMRFGFGASTGGYHDKHLMDNLDISVAKLTADWADSEDGASAFSPPTSQGSKKLRLRSEFFGAQKITLIARDALGLETHKELRFVVVSPREPATLSDTNGDGLWDDDSIRAGVDPLEEDHDGDGLSNAVELAMGTDPFNPDTDGDGVPDDEDAWPLDPLRSSPLAAVPGDTTPPEIMLYEPDGATLLP